ncbi:MAG: histidine kinase [Panacibacter sp.]
MQQNTFHIKRDRKGWVTIALHVLIWLMVFLIPYIFSADVKSDSHEKDNDQNMFLYLNTALNFCWVALFYFNAGVLIPRFIYKRKIALYVLALLGMFAIVVLFDKILFTLLSIPRVFSIYHSVEHNFIAFAFTVAVSGAYKAITDKTKADIWISQKQSEHFKTELSFLRSQVSPHFLFNVLNNITALARLKSDDLEPTVMKLSSLMRYMLYETDEEKVVIKNEAEYLQDYIDLQKQRFGDELTLLVLFDLKEEWHAIEPMLLIPFVENAFKHGGGLIQHPEIFIRLEVDNSELQYTVKNKFEESETTKDKASGIGLTNVKRRLELLYPDKHKLTIDKKDRWFIIDLHIILK